MELTGIQTTAGRDGVRDLLRYRGVQILLAAVAVVQGAVTVQRTGEEEAQPGIAAKARTQVLALPPVVVMQPVREEAPKQAARPAAEPEEHTEALELAEKYQKKGYRVSAKLARIIVEAAQEHEIDPEIAFGLVRAESGFRTSATSPVGAIGLTQLMPRTARWLEPGVTTRELRDPATNLRIGFGYLRDLIEKYDGNERLALLAYNRGPGTVDKALKRGRNPDNGYADFVLGKKNHGHTLYTRQRR
ncbi:MAG TPA: lytic transglycosylase domain-containing protein [Longimicrobiaceae bacterium]|nr:lytic transglycosylase domain-containing protein [Longimicrobiaceae bacterium]